MIIQSGNLVKNPKVSVVIATYNQVGYIEQTINSVLSQNCAFPFEIIVADDLSNDGNRELLITLHKKNPEQIKLIFNEVNLMVTRNYVNAIHEARGEYIATLDGDDYYIDNSALSILSSYLDDHKDVTLVHSSFKGYDDNTQKYIYTRSDWRSKMLLMKGLDSAYELLMERMPYYPLGSTSCFRRSVYIEGCVKYVDIINESAKFGEGTILNISCSMAGRIGYINKPLSAYRILPVSLCHHDSLEKKYLFGERYFKVKLIAANVIKLDDKRYISLAKKELSKIRNFSCNYGYMDSYFATLHDLTTKIDNKDVLKLLNRELDYPFLSKLKASIHNLISLVYRKTFKHERA